MSSCSALPSPSFFRSRGAETGSLPAALPSHVRVERYLPQHNQRSGSDAIRVHSPRLVLVRGLPGSGKSTIARALAGCGWTHLEADQFFETPAGYRFVPQRVRDAHAWCQAEARRALAAHGAVVVANTFTRVAELAPYLRMGAEKLSNIEEMTP